MRATIRPLGVSSVILRYTDPYSGARRTREFTVIGKDVREYRADGNTMFVGNGLLGGGWSLRVGDDGLLATVRREYKVWKRNALR